MVLVSSPIPLLRAAKDTTENPREVPFKDYIKKMNLDLDPIENESEYLYRLSVFSSNMVLIEEFNARPGKREGSMTMGMTRFSHWTQEEFADFVNQGKPPSNVQRPAQAKGLKIPIHKGPLSKTSSSSSYSFSSSLLSSTSSMSKSTGTDYPSDKDWVKTGAVTPVKNQMMCGDCWSFSATGSLEGAYFVEYGELPGNLDTNTGFFGLSEQQLTACDMLSFGCNAGYTESGWIYALENGGLVGEGDYPFVLGDFHGGVIGTGNQTCNSINNFFNINQKVAPNPKTPFTSVDPTVDSFMDAIQLQPISIQIEASSRLFQFYNGGVISNIESYGWFGPNYYPKHLQCGTDLDHAVLLVGYGTFVPVQGNKKGDSIDYWKVKNSWGELWGDDGYVRIERSGDNTCGLLLGGQYPNLGSDKNYDNGVDDDVSPTYSSDAIKTLKQTLDQETAYFLEKNAKTPEQVRPVSVSISGTAVEGQVDNAILCLSQSFFQSHRLMVWIVGFVQNDNTYATYLAFQNDGNDPVGASTFWPFLVQGYNIELSCEALDQYSTTSMNPNNLTVSLETSDLQINELNYIVYGDNDNSAGDVNTYEPPSFIVREQSLFAVLFALVSVIVIFLYMLDYAKRSSLSSRSGRRSNKYMTIEMNDHEIDLGHGPRESTTQMMRMSYQQQDS